MTRKPSISRRNRIHWHYVRDDALSSTIKREVFDPIPRTPEDSEKESDDEEEKESRLSEEARIQEEEDVEELYRKIEVIGNILLRVWQTNQFADAVSTIPGIVHQYMDQQMKEAVREAVQIQTDRLQDSLQRENDEFLRNIDENMKKVFKGLVKNQVKEQVSRILPRIKESVNATLEAEVLTQSSHSSRTSYAIAADLSEMEIKKILIEKMEGNKSIQRSDEQRNLYKALVEAYEADKAILDTYGDSTILKRRKEDDDQEGPSAGPNQGSKRPKEGGEQASANTPSEKVTKGTGGSTTGFQSRQRLNVDTLTPDLLVGPTYKLMRGSCTSLTELEYHLEEVYKATTD
nr:hypothetical protein [Tanacetum cinerariifolium]